MQTYNTRPSEEIALLGKINPASSSGARNSGYISAAGYRWFRAILIVGDIASTGTLDMKIRQAQDSGGTGVKDISGKAITQLTDADDNKVCVIEWTAEEMDIAGGFTHLYVLLTAATAASISGVIVEGLHSRYTPVSTALIEEVVV